MTKRAARKFERRERDFYPTPRAAVLPLIPHLRAARVRRFAEPCCGDGDIVRQLESFGLACVYQGDLATGQDALARDSYGAIDAIITNPPYDREPMHALIAHFAKIAPAWLLLELDWASTKQAFPFLRSCSNILAIGRLKWMGEDTKSAGFDNFAWFRFDARHTSEPIFHTKDSVPDVRPTRRCEQCGSPFRPSRSDGRFCSDTCRKRAQRARLSVT